MTKQQTTVISNAAALAAERAVQVKADAIFELADAASTSFAVQLAGLGLDSRALAKPFAMRWAAKKYHAKIESGQRGDKLPRDSAADKAMHRVLNVCFEVKNPFAGAGKQSNEDVALPRGLVKKIKAEIIGAGCDKKQFNALLKALREEITFA